MHLQSYDCVLCNEPFEEMVEHLFLHCSFARDCWNLVGIQVPTAAQPLEILESFKTQLGVSFFIWRS